MNKNNYRVLLLLFASLLFFYVGGNAYSQEKTVVEKKVIEFAQTSLKGYIKNVLSEENVGNFGFQSKPIRFSLNFPMAKCIQEY